MQLTLRELAATVSTVVAAADVRGANRRSTDLPDERTIRWYATIGLLDRPTGHRGRTALYGERHVLQLVAIKRLQAQGRTLAEIQDDLVGATEPTLRTIAAVPNAIEPVPAVEQTHDAPVRARRFWSEPAASGDGVLTGVALGGGAVLLLPEHPGPADVAAIHEAARALLDVLADRHLLREGT